MENNTMKILNELIDQINNWRNESAPFAKNEKCAFQDYSIGRVDALDDVANLLDTIRIRIQYK